MSDQKTLERLQKGGKLSPEDIIYAAQRENVPGVPKLDPEVIDSVGGQEVLEAALNSNEGLEGKVAKAQKKKKDKEPSKAEVEKKAKKAKESPDPDDTQGYQDEGSKGGAKIADGSPKAADDDDD